VDVRILKTLVAVAEHGTFSAATAVSDVGTGADKRQSEKSSLLFKQLVKVCSPDETTPSSGEETARTSLLDDDKLRRALQTAALSSAAE
jgi:hypothetical protein